MLEIFIFDFACSPRSERIQLITLPSVFLFASTLGKSEWKRKAQEGKTNLAYISLSFLLT